ncbi:MAG: 50S ribosomal protein L13 [Rickettsiales bacterium]|jgi:large subunit ribosomal protein L13|nr:50S ribosomal protein L13 [Rickettsiales bacterium]
MNLTKSTKSLRAKELSADWYLIDATDITLGRLAAYVATLLRGKNKPTFTPNMDCGDHVIIINAEKIALTGNKADGEKFYWHTGWTGGIKERTLGQMRNEKPEQLVFNAVKRMMGRRTAVALADKRLTKLHIYAGAEHKHSAQNPKTIDFGAMNRKNKRGE